MTVIARAATPDDLAAIRVLGETVWPATYARHSFVVTRHEPAERAGWPDQIWAERIIGGA